MHLHLLLISILCFTKLNHLEVQASPTKVKELLGVDWIPSTITVDYKIREGIRTIEGTAYGAISYRPELLEKNPPVLEITYEDRFQQTRKFRVDKEELVTFLKAYTMPRSRWKIPRKSGGFAAGKIHGLYFTLTPEKGVDTSFIFTFREYLRDGNRGKQGKPILDPKRGFIPTTVMKERQRPRSRFIWRVPSDPADQRFVMDFNGEEIFPVMVLGFRGDKAVFTSVDYKFDFKRMEPGAFYESRIYEVDAKLLRLATDEDYEQASQRYFEERDAKKVGQIIRANRVSLADLGGQNIKTVTGQSFTESFNHLKDSIPSLDPSPGLGPGANQSLCDFMDGHLASTYRPVW